MTRRHSGLVAAVIAACAWAAGCGGTATTPSRHPASGLVLRADAGGRRLVISHGDVPGAMPAMTMPFEVAPGADLSGIGPGARVAFTMVLGGDVPRAEDVRVVHYESAHQDPATTRQLRLLTWLGRERPKPVAPGDAVPDFTLTNQALSRIRLSDLRGTVVALNFIYTNCVYPQFCLRITNHFAEVANRFAGRMGRDLVLVTISFDPARDTPEQLAAYARQWDADPRTWHFLTGTAAEIERVATAFDVDFFPDEGLMNHSVRTAVIDRRGRLVANIEGNEYTAAQLGDLVESALAAD